jgi:hypothetical protein
MKRFVLEWCERGRGLRPDWAVKGLEFLYFAANPTFTKAGGATGLLFQFFVYPSASFYFITKPIKNRSQSLDFYTINISHSNMSYSSMKVPRRRKSDCPKSQFVELGM